MKHIISAIVMVGVLVVGSTFPAEARGGRGGGFHGGGGRSHAGSFRGGHGFHGTGFRGGSLRGSHGFHGSRFHGSRLHGGTRVVIGAGLGWWGWPGWWGSGWWGAPYPYYASAPMIVQPPPVYIEQSMPGQAATYWYYCEQAQGYYPYVTSCPGGWMTVVPPTAPPAP